MIKLSIASEITRINQNISNAYSALENKGAIIPQQKNSDNLISTISSITALDEYLEGGVVNYQGHATKIVESALRYTDSLVSVDLPNVERVDRYGFANCNNLITARLESCTYLHTEAFYSCSKLESVYIPELTNVGGTYSAGQSGNFAYCRALKSVNFPKLKNIGAYEFNNSGLEVADFPEVTQIASFAFVNCPSLTYAKLPKATTFSDDIFSGCTNLVRVETPSATTMFGPFCANCTSLTAWVLGTRLSYPSNFSLPQQVIIYVDSSDLGWYQSTSGWSTFYNAGRIKSVDELPPMETT